MTAKPAGYWVLDEQTQPGSYIDLNSEQAKEWKADRVDNPQCFPQ
ncbi:MAG: hypothetical protein Q3965_06240 [Rothia sp. (in: high G+C Gram-positive bacteria)]|nr:hypothetical protein [Rothia sp. (in: high G+C Gram-positive bacteria)]